MVDCPHCPKCGGPFRGFISSSDGEPDAGSLCLCSECESPMILNDDGSFKLLEGKDLAALPGFAREYVVEALTGLRKAKEAAAAKAAARSRPLLHDVQVETLPCATCGAELPVPKDSGLKLDLNTMLYCIQGHQRSVAACILRAYEAVVESRAKATA